MIKLIWDTLSLRHISNTLRGNVYEAEYDSEGTKLWSFLDKHVLEYEYMLEISIIYFPYLAVQGCLLRNTEAKQRVIGDILLPILNVFMLFR